MVFRMNKGRFASLIILGTFTVGVVSSSAVSAQGEKKASVAYIDGVGSSTTCTKAIDSKISNEQAIAAIIFAVIIFVCFLKMKKKSQIRANDKKIKQSGSNELKKNNDGQNKKVERPDEVEAKNERSSDKSQIISNDNQNVNKREEEPKEKVKRWLQDHSDSLVDKIRCIINNLESYEKNYGNIYVNFSYLIECCRCDFHFDVLLSFLLFGSLEDKEVFYQIIGQLTKQNATKLLNLLYEILSTNPCNAFRLGRFFDIMSKSKLTCNSFLGIIDNLDKNGISNLAKIIVFDFFNERAQLFLTSIMHVLFANGKLAELADCINKLNKNGVRNFSAILSSLGENYYVTNKHVAKIFVESFMDPEVINSKSDGGGLDGEDKVLKNIEKMVPAEDKKIAINKSSFRGIIESEKKINKSPIYFSSGDDI